MCNLQPTGATRVSTANGETVTDTYLISMGLPNGVGFCSLRVTEGNISGFDILIGMDVIAQGDFAVTSFEGKTVCSYRYPSMEKLDFVEDLNRLIDKQKRNTPPNSPCLCGSGKKFKKCCGKRV